MKIDVYNLNNTITPDIRRTMLKVTVLFKLARHNYIFGYLILILHIFNLNAIYALI